MKIRFVLPLLALVCITYSCSLSSGSSVKGLKGLLASSNCHGPCGKIMSCEGKDLTVEVELRNNNVMTSGTAIFLRDPDNYDYTFRLNFAQSIPAEVYSDIKNQKYKRVVFTGIVEGFDQYVHESCTRSYSFKIADKANFKLLEK